ncbi:ATP-dependent 6-phosphofructokinase [Crocosphaera sp. UHCC 0190]|uniref:ATP-dependent 6-phosphofructokinase n=1 Tax=Crocosphaera sp. UHCC 0190 TaxID=3110246 RepID=UPI002B1ED678|nr:ATP-dependent 6-phosphofructokinase [Crocosphaera sp. UHCC 0190]MEA5508431.1 ATP-dependent 6-phosphofructokinase [Crocosphaera sp. UHCC 0190]
MQTKRIGILTSGGDCPGLNAVIRAVVKASEQKGWTVYGIPYGTDGFMHIAQEECLPDDLILTGKCYQLPGRIRGLDVLQFFSGSVLGSISKGHPENPDVKANILKGYDILGLDALIVIGGDGSLDIIYDLAKAGNWNIVAIPKTIDNDVPATEFSVGFTTAVEIVTQALYDLTFTAASHERIMIVQAMGRDAGHLALRGGIAGGADIILIPELTPCLTLDVIDDCCHHLLKLRESGRHFALVVIAEGVKTQDQRKESYIGDYLLQQIKEYSQILCHEKHQDFCTLKDVDMRVTVLGHLQRSHPPVAWDRLLATAFGIKAVELIESNHYDRLVVWQKGQVSSKCLSFIMTTIKERRQKKQCTSPVDPQDYLVKTARSLGIYLGDP